MRQMSLYREFSSIVSKLCEPYMEKHGVELPPLELPDQALGDVAVPCFTLAKTLRKSPHAIAQDMVESMDCTNVEIQMVEASGGYVNFTMKPRWVAEKGLSDMLSRDYGKHPSTGEKMVLEHTSANPTDKLHVGRARNPIIGDTLARICRYAGYDVETQYYVDDMGRQAVTLAFGKHLYEQDRIPEEMKREHMGPYQLAAAGTTASHALYNPLWEKECGEWLQNLEKGSVINVGNTTLQDYVDQACEDIMENKIGPSLMRIDVSIDKHVYESSFMKDGTVSSVIEKLKRHSSAARDDNGAWYIDMEPHGITGRSTKFFFTRGDGTSLYATRDIAYHLWKLENYDRVVDVLGEDHRLEAKQVAVALGLLGQEKMPEVVFYSFVGLPEGKMSTRAGKVIYFDDLLKQGVERAMEEVASRRPELDEEDRQNIAEAVGVSAVRYNISRIQPEKKMVFRWDDALNFEGDSAPFIQYSYARASSILKKSEHTEEHTRKGDAGLLVHPSETALIKHLARLPDVVEDCASTMRPHIMAAYAHSAAVLFNQFYRDCPVLSEEKNLRNARLTMVSATRNVLGKTLHLLGLAVLEEM